MHTKDFTTTLWVTQSPNEVFKAIKNVAGWWSHCIEGQTLNLHDKFKMDFGRHWWAFEIIELVPDKKIVWYVTDSYMPWNENNTEWTDTKIVFEITRTGDKTQLQFTHLGLTPQCFCFQGCSKGWTGYIQESLLNLITTGRGNPDHPY